MSVDIFNWLQSDLPSFSFQKDRLNLKSSLTILDQKPNYENQILVDTLSQKFKDDRTFCLFNPSTLLNPIHLVDTPDDNKLISHLGDRLQRYIEAICNGTKNHPENTTLVESPLSSLAWLLFSKALKTVDENKANASINFIKYMIFGFQNKRMSKLDYNHYVILKNYDLTNTCVPDIIKEDLALFQKREKIFESSMITAAKIVSKHSIAKVKLIRL